jgi:2-dehydro-3-deoxyphosphogluconate aldolase/(4S)-4-hydroxy-2-oxoglutarate aldolase
MPTGGVSLDEENISDWFKAGVSAVGMGSKLRSKLISNNYWKKRIMQKLKSL